ncbi:hypothetical protein OF83DRAFT_909555 [Amylostereum chailletii]|nr:hypothetical protein OF83DRAFT_909555 [Amylostereum chailletii]
MWELYCPICCSTFRPNDAKHFRSLACGHTFCEGCILRHFEAREHKRQDPDCPSCRAPATEDDVRPIYFEIRDGNGELFQVEPSTSGSSPAIMQHLNHVRKGLQMIEPGTAESSVKKTGDKIWEIVDAGDTIAQTELLKEVASFFKQRVVPIFSEILERRNEVNLLRKQAREDKVEKDRLGRTIQLDRQAATGSNARLIDKVENLEAANAQLLKELDLLRREKSDREALEKDIKSYKGQLELWKDNG